MAQRSVIVHGTAAVRVLHQHAKHALRKFEILPVAQLYVNAQRLRTRLHHGNCLRMAAAIHQKHIARLSAAAQRPPAQRHRFCRSRALIQQRTVRHGQRSQIGNQRLEIKQRFHAPLRNLCLIWRVRGIPAGVLQNVALNDCRRNAVVIAHANKRAEHMIARGQVRQLLHHVCLTGSGRHLQRSFHADGGRHDARR